MLQGLRTASSTWVGRILLAIVMGFIIISFAIWGIGNIFQGFGQNRLAVVGRQEISVTAYRDAYQTALQQFQRQTRQGITNEQARLLGIDRQVLAEMVSNAAMDQKAHALGLSMSDAEIARLIAAEPAFRNPSGAFDRDQFLGLLRDNGYTEKSFVAEQRNVYLRREITDAISADVKTPNAALEAMNRYRNEARSIDYVVLPPTAAGDIPAPTEDQLKTAFETHRASYRAPEFRQILVLAVTPPKPERRELGQIVFGDEAEAKAASDRIKAGTSFDDIAAERKISPADIDLGSKAKSDLADPAVADAAFSLPEGGVSEPIKLAFGAALVHVVKIHPQTTLDIAKIHDQIEDLRTSGKSLTEAAKAAGLEPRTIEAVDAGGRDRSGAPVPDLPEKAALLKAVFASDIGVDNDTIPTADKGYVWFEVTKIDPARDRSFDEARGEVETAWRAQETAKRLSDKAADIVRRLDTGETIQSIAATEKVEAKTAANIRRAGSSDLPPAAVAQVFAVSATGAGSAPGSDGSRIVFKVTASTVPPLDPNNPEVKATADEYGRALEADIGAQFAAKVQADLGVSVNEQALRLAAGGD